MGAVLAFIHNCPQTHMCDNAELDLTLLNRNPEEFLSRFITAIWIHYNLSEIKQCVSPTKSAPKKTKVMSVKKS